MSKDARDFTETSPKRISPKKAHVDCAHRHASKGSERLRDARNVCSITRVMGGCSGRCRWPAAACMFSIPRIPARMTAVLASDSGGGQFWAMCQARIADMYFRAVAIETKDVEFS